MTASSCILLYGADTFRLKRKVAEIRARYAELHTNAFHASFFDCEDTSPDVVARELETSSLFQTKKLLILENPFSSHDIHALLVAQKDRLFSEKDRVVVCMQEGEIQKTDALFRACSAKGIVQKFQLLGGAKLIAWMQKEFLKYATTVDAAALEFLRVRVGNDLWRLSEEIKKLAAYGKSQASSVHAKDAALLVRGEHDPHIFTTVEAIASGNVKLAAELIFLHQQRGDSPFYIFSMLQNQLRAMLQIRDLAEKGTPAVRIAAMTKLHPFVVKKGYEVSRRFSLQQLKRAFGKLFDMDLALKTGRMEPAQALYAFAEDCF